MDAAADEVLERAVPVTAALRLAGHLDGRRSAEVRQRLAEHVRSHPADDVVIDMTEVESVDATVLTVLAALAVRLSRSGQVVVLSGCTPATRRVLAQGGWRRLFRLDRPT